ncbi:hypothetical protein PQX77_008624, partial [Marasmius sp. AFHP31]
NILQRSLPPYTLGHTTPPLNQNILSTPSGRHAMKLKRPLAVTLSRTSTTGWPNSRWQTGRTSLSTCRPLTKENSSKATSTF